jgi:hypothetical protein
VHQGASSVALRGAAQRPLQDLPCELLRPPQSPRATTGPGPLTGRMGYSIGIGGTRSAYRLCRRSKTQHGRARPAARQPHRGTETRNLSEVEVAGPTVRKTAPLKKTAHPSILANCSSTCIISLWIQERLAEAVPKPPSFWSRSK